MQAGETVEIFVKGDLSEPRERCPHQLLDSLPFAAAVTHSL